MTKISPAGDITLAVLIFLEQLSGAVVWLAGSGEAGGGGGCPGAEEYHQQVGSKGRYYQREAPGSVTLARSFLARWCGLLVVRWWLPRGRGSDQDITSW